MEKEHSLVGILRPVGVLPQFRRRGIAMQLLLLQLRDLLDMGCDLSYLGNPYNNKKAILTYEKVGFSIIDRQIVLRKDLD